MDTIKVRAHARVLGLEPGDEVDVQETDLIRGAISNGYLQRVGPGPQAGAVSGGAAVPVPPKPAGRRKVPGGGTSHDQ